MALIAGKQWEKTGEPDLVLFHENGRQIKPGKGVNHPTNSEDQPAETIKFWLQPLSGRVNKQIADESFVTKKRKGHLLQGTAAMIKVVNSVIAVEG